MKTITKSILAGATLLIAGCLCQTASAALSTSTDYAATLSNGSSTFTVNSEYYLFSPGEYAYTYSFSGANDPLGLSSLSVYFNTTVASVTDIGGSVTGAGSLSGTGLNPTDVYWEFNPNSDNGYLYFLSPIPAQLGTISAQDGGLWGNGSGGVAYGVVVPTIPDGGLTISLLGGALLGLGAFRRKLGC